jgi:hypothetical protein
LVPAAGGTAGSLPAPDFAGQGTARGAAAATLSLADYRRGRRAPALPLRDGLRTPASTTDDVLGSTLCSLKKWLSAQSGNAHHAPAKNGHDRVRRRRRID